MADQKRIKLYSLHATPKNIILRELPVANANATTKIYLYPGHATAKNIIIGDPTAIRVVIGGDSEALSGIATLILTTTGALASGTALSGVSILTLTTTGALVSTVDFSGEATLVLLSAGTLDSTSSFNGAATIAVVSSGSLGASIPFNGLVSLSLQATGDLLIQGDVWTNADGLKIYFSTREAVSPLILSMNDSRYSKLKH